MNFESIVLSTYRPAGLIRVRGEDAFGFLQGQFTNELRQPPGSATYGLWLNQRGKVLADSEVLRLAENEFLLMSTFSPAAVIQRRLEEYIVADDVVLTDETASAHGLWVGGAAAGKAIEQLLGEVPGTGRWGRKGNAFCFGGRRLPGRNFEVWGIEKAVAELRRLLVEQGGVETDVGDMEFTRISAGIPVVPADLGPGDLPQEGGLEDSALSYAKGCYLGQEVMARLKNLGQVRRRLHVVQGRGTPPAALTALYQGERKIGELRSVARRGDEFVAWAMLSLVSLNPQAGLSLVPGGPVAVTLARHG